MLDNFKPLQDEWVTKGHTHRNEFRFMNYIWDNFLNHFKMIGLWRGILTEMNPGFMHCCYL